MTRFIKTNTKKDAAPIYLRDDITVLYEDTAIAPNTEISFYAPEEGRVLVLNKRGHNVTIDDFLPAFTAANGPYIRLPIYWSTEKEYACAYIRPDAITYLTADEPHDLAMKPGHKAVRVVMGVQGINQISTHALSMNDFSTLISTLKTTRPDLVRLLPKDAVASGTIGKTAVTLLDSARIDRLKFNGDRMSVFYRGCGSIDLLKPEIDRDLLFSQAIADDPANDDPEKLTQIFNDALRIRREDLQYIGRSLAAQSPNLVKIEEASSTYYTTPAAILQISVAQMMGLNQLLITYNKSFASAYGVASDTVTFETPQKMQAALEKLTGTAHDKAAPQPPPKPAGP